MMSIVAGAVSCALIAVTAYLALSKTTAPQIRRAAIGALILAGIALAACSLILFFLLAFPGGPRAVHNGEIPAVPVEKTKNSLIPVLIFSVAILVVILVIIFASLREQKRMGRSRRPGRQE
jgi:lysylphosphatidylglycerol synthetase-like protein (DUF2156 family)